MHKTDEIIADCLPTASGILLCLRMLTEEALSLDLRRSVLALRAAALVMEAETSDLEVLPRVGMRFATTADIDVR